MTEVHPPAAPPVPMSDVSYPPTAPTAPPTAPVAPPAAAAPQAISNVAHPPVEAGPVVSSEPLPVPAPTGISRSAVTAEPPPVKVKVDMTEGILPENRVNQPAARSTVKKEPGPVAPPAAPVATVTVNEISAVAGIPSDLPVISMPEGFRTVDPSPYVISDSVRALATRHGVDLAEVQPTGRGKRITRRDVEAHLAAAESAVAEAVPSTTDDLEEVDEEYSAGPASAPLDVVSQSGIVETTEESAEELAQVLSLPRQIVTDDPDDDDDEEECGEDEGVSDASDAAEIQPYEAETAVPVEVTEPIVPAVTVTPSPEPARNEFPDEAPLTASPAVPVPAESGDPTSSLTIRYTPKPGSPIAVTDPEVWRDLARRALNNLEINISPIYCDGCFVLTVQIPTTTILEMNL